MFLDPMWRVAEEQKWGIRIFRWTDWFDRSASICMGKVDD